MKFLFFFFFISIVSLSAQIPVASLSTITTELAQKIGGDQVTVIALVGPDIDPHEFQPTPDDLKKITGAALVLASGKGLEGYLPKLARAAGNVPVVRVGDTFPSLRLEEDGQTVEDPHWWHSPANMRLAVRTVTAALSKVRPDQAAVFDRNAAAYAASLDELEKWARVKIAELPRDQRKLVTSHDAFQYFARDFGFTIFAIEGVSTDDQPGSAKVAALIQAIQDRHVKAVFYENIQNPKVTREITRETGAKIGGELYADGLGAGDASTYDGMFRHNVNTLVNALK